MSGLQQLLRMFVCLLVTIGFLASLLRAPAQTKADTATSPSWITGLLVHHDEVLPAGQSAPAASPTGGHCLDYTFNFKVKPIGQAVQYNEQPEACAVITNYGIAAGRYLHENGEKYAGRMSRGNTVYLPVPNSNKLLEIKGGFFPKKHLHVYRDFINQSLVRTENNWFMTYAPSGSQIVQDQAGNLVNIDSNFLKTSTNSLWAIAFSPNKSLIRVNLDSTEPLPFGLSTKPLTGAVSNSGQFVAAHYINEATLIYDLSICGSVPSTINGPVDCDERDISQYLIDQFGPNNGVERIKFLDDYHLELYVKQTNANNEIYFRKVQLTLNGHQIIDNSSTYIAMGDSFASGEGDLDDSWYELGTDEPENKCHLSRRSYPYLLDLALGFEEFHSVACSGAETVHVLNIRQNNELPPVNSLGEWLPGVVPQLELLKFSPQFVTISIGGNDLGFKDKLINCLLPTTCDYADNPEKRANVAKEIANLFKTLTNAYKQLVVKTDAQTKIYVVGYPQIIQPAGACGLNVHLDSAEREFAYQTAKYLNQIIKFAAARAGVYYLDTESAFGGFNLCSGVDDQDMVVNGLSITNTPAFRLNNGWLSFGGRAKFVLPGFSESYHPNPNGHQLLKQSIMALTDNNPALFNVCVESAVKVCPQDAQIPLPNETYWGQSTVDFVASLNNNETAGSLPPIYHKLLDDSKSDQVRVTLGHLQPGSTVKVEVHSEPKTLGEFTVDEDGLLDITLPVSADVLPGFHTLYLYGQETTGEPVAYYEHIWVTGPEDDIDADGLSDNADSCLFAESSGTDQDQDGVDDACDGYIGLAPQVLDSSTESGQNNSESSPSGDPKRETAQGDTAGEEPAVVVSTNSHNEDTVVVVDEDGVISGATGSGGVDDKNGYPMLIMWLLVSSGGLIGLSYLLRRYSMNS